MARIQILQLPDEWDGDNSTTPFAVIIDQADEKDINALRRDLGDGGIAAKLDARAVLVFETTIDIPANAAPASHTAGSNLP